MMVLVIGGSGSGKSSYAESRILSCKDASERYYLATMQVYGEEGRRKVERHRQMRKEKGFETIEQQTAIAEAVSKMKNPEKAAVLLECISNLTANEMFSKVGQISRQEVRTCVISDIAQLNKAAKHLIVVSNNVFEDGILYEESTMEYIRAMGEINQSLAKIADEVVELVVGIPVYIKERQTL